MSWYNIFSLFRLRLNGNLIVCLCLISVYFNQVTTHERLPPGVNPQNYQPGINPQHYQESIPNPGGGHQVPHQAGPPVPVQQQQQYAPHPPQQVPQQQQQYAPPPPQQQAPQQQHQPHGHGGHEDPQLFNNVNFEHEREHMKEHMDIPLDTSKMTEQELQFHYFKMHDSDNNNMLDGCELAKSLIHWHEQGRNNPQQGANIPPPKIFADNELEQLIDPILAMDDVNHNGYIDYAEFVMAQKKSAGGQQK